MKTIFQYSLIPVFLFSGSASSQIYVPTDLPTITEAISVASPGQTIYISSGIYLESVNINKKLTLLGEDTTVIIQPPSGVGITVTADTITIQSLKITVPTHPSSGISANGRKALTLTNVVVRGDSGTGVQLNNIQGLTVTGCKFSDNKDEGLNIATGSNVIISNTEASGNGTLGDGSGINLNAVAGTSVLTNVTARLNRRHGITIGSGSSGITITGGTFNKNGSARGTNGGGIFIFAETASVTNMTINGTLNADSNATAGVWLSSESALYPISGTQIGQKIGRAHV